MLSLALYGLLTLLLHSLTIHFISEIEKGVRLTPTFPLNHCIECDWITDFHCSECGVPFCESCRLIHATTLCAVCACFHARKALLHTLQLFSGYKPENPAPLKLILADEEKTEYLTVARKCEMRLTDEAKKRTAIRHIV
jgi:hypothetical protein